MKTTIKDIKKYYNNKIVLDVDRLEFEKGKITGILGPNGSGKSTLMTIVAGLNMPDEGSLLYEGKVFDEVRNTITYMSHNSYLFNDNVYNNIAYPLRFRGVDKNEIKNIVNSLIDELEIDYLSDKSALKLSGGERQKVCLARAISFNPSLLIVDEPTSNIDPSFTKLIEDILKIRNKKFGTTILIVTHNTSQAFRICDNLVFIDNSKILYAGTAAGAKNSDNKKISDFIELN